MPELETYVSKINPSVEDWVAYNGAFFSQLKGESSVGTLRYAPLVDVDLHAAKAGTSTEDYFEQIQQRVGPLGRAALELVHSEMDDAWHVIVAPIEETT